MTSGTIILDKSTVLILINATTLMHKSTLSTNDFGINHFGQKYSSDFNYCDIFKAYVNFKHERLREQSFWTKVQ